MSRKRKYSDEFKLKVVLEYLSGTAGGFKLVAKKYGLDDAMLRRWVLWYNDHGAEGLQPVSGSYTGEFRVHVVEYMHRNDANM